ncbi:hypothetical protein ACYSNO_00810 [Enterococcus sp. LJL98]
MSELIPFPEKAEQLSVSGTRKMLAHDYLAAKKDFLLLYEMSPDFTNVQKLVEALRLLGNFEEAVFFAKEYEANYLSEEDTLKDYLRLLLLDGQYLKVHQLLQIKPDERLQKELLQLEAAQNLIGTNEYDEKKRQLAAWDQKGLPVLGTVWSAWLKRLTLAQLIHLAKIYLVGAQNPFLPPKLIEELLTCGVKEKILMGTLLHKKKQVDISCLSTLEKSRELQLLLQLIAETWENQDPQMAEGIALEAQAHFALLYPFLPPLKEIPAWAESYRLEYLGMFGDEKALETLQSYTEIQKRKQKLREIYQDLS